MTAIQSTGDDTTLRIDIVSDVVCPWCIVGFKQLEQAIARTGVTAMVKWHPFELNPDMPAEGENLREHIMRKYGTSAAQSQAVRDRLTELGKDLGFKFRFADDMRMVNTFKAHQLIHWAGPHGKEHQMKMALFAAYFQDRKDLNDTDVLADVAQDQGLERADALRTLEDAQYAELVRKEEAFWTGNGIQGVPAVIFQQKHLVTGAQGVENYEAIINQLLKDAAA